MDIQQLQGDTWDHLDDAGFLPPIEPPEDPGPERPRRPKRPYRPQGSGVSLKPLGIIVPLMLAFWGLQMAVVAMGSQAGRVGVYGAIFTFGLLFLGPMWAGAWWLGKRMEEARQRD